MIFLLPEIEISHDTFSLHPPVTVSVNVACGIVLLVDHTALGGEPLSCGSRNPGHFLLHSVNDAGISKNESGLVKQPGSLDVVAI